MTLDQSALLEFLEALKAADVDDRIRQAAETMYQAMIEAELSAVIGAAPYQRTEARIAQRNGHRPRTVSTTPPRQPNDPHCFEHLAIDPAVHGGTVADFFNGKTYLLTKS